MRPFVATLLAPALLVPAAAWAQQVTLYDGPDEGAEPDLVVEAFALPSWSRGGAESVSVAWDADEGLWIMLVGTRFSEEGLRRYGVERAGCAAGSGDVPEVFAVARAFSADGLNWLIDAEPALTAGNNGFDACGYRRPRLHALPPGSGAAFAVAYSAVQTFDACADGQPTWGCDRQPGAHFAVGPNGRTWIEVKSDGPAWPLSGIEQVSTLIHQAEGAPAEATRLIVLGSRADGGVYVAEGPVQLEARFPVPERAVIRPGTWAWSRTRWMAPSATCGPRGERFQFQVWLAGSTDGGGSGLDPLISADTRDWFGDGRPAVAWPGEPQWLGWDTIRSGGATYLYHIVPTADGGAIRLARAGGSGDFVLDPANDLTRTCLYGEPPDLDTGEDTDIEDTDTADTGNTGDSDTGPADSDSGSTDTDVPPADGCYCTSGVAPWAGWPAALGLALAIGRRLSSGSSRSSGESRRS